MRFQPDRRCEVLVRVSADQGFELLGRFPEARGMKVIHRGLSAQRCAIGNIQSSICRRLRATRSWYNAPLEALGWPRRDGEAEGLVMPPWKRVDRLAVCA